MRYNKKNNNNLSVVYWNNIPAPYMVERFNALANHRNFNFRVWFNDRSECDRSWIVDESDWHFSHIFLKRLTIINKRFLLPTPLLKRDRPDVLISLYAKPVFLIGFIIAKIRGIKIGFWVEKTFDSWVKRTKIKEAIKKWIFQRVDFILTTGDDGREYVQRYFIDPKRIHVLPHFIDADYFRREHQKAKSKDKFSQNKIDKDVVVYLYVGRIIPEKGINYLLDAFNSIKSTIDFKAQLLLAGDGAAESAYKAKCLREGIRNVHFIGFHQKTDLPSIYAKADIFVFPTLGDPYGLVVDEAMACSLPIIATSAAGEIDVRVKNGINGYIVASENSSELSEAMHKLGTNKQLRIKMGMASEKMISGHTPTKWAISLKNIISKVR